MDRPDRRGREAILGVHVRRQAALARGGPVEPRQADARLYRRRYRKPGERGGHPGRAAQCKRTIGMPEFQEAIERVIAGPERRSRLISEHEKRVIAYHEAGHTLVQSKLPNCDPVHKVSIVARGHGGRLYHDAAGGRPLLYPRASSRMIWPGCWAGASPKARLWRCDHRRQR
jgi:cell division protease FtsH